jgi:hypothetical protein
MLFFKVLVLLGSTGIHTVVSRPKCLLSFLHQVRAWHIAYRNYSRPTRLNGSVLESPSRWKFERSKAEIHLHDFREKVASHSELVRTVLCCIGFIANPNTRPFQLFTYKKKENRGLTTK